MSRKEEIMLKREILEEVKKEINYKKKIEFKKEILEEIKECMLFDGENYSLNKNQLNRIILQYEMEIEGIRQYFEY